MFLRLSSNFGALCYAPSLKMAFAVSGFNFSFPWKSLHNVFIQNTQVNFNFGNYVFYGFRVMLLFTLAGSGGISVLSC